MLQFDTVLMKAVLQLKEPWLKKPYANLRLLCATDRLFLTNSPSGQAHSPLAQEQQARRCQATAGRFRGNRTPARESSMVVVIRIMHFGEAQAIFRNWLNQRTEGAPPTVATIRRRLVANCLPCVGNAQRTNRNSNIKPELTYQPAVVLLPHYGGLSLPIGKFPLVIPHFPDRFATLFYENGHPSEIQ